MNSEKKPTLWREITKAAGIFLAVSAAVGILVTIVFYGFRHNRATGLIVLFACATTGFGGMQGWFNYKWKKQDWDERQKRAHEEAERQRSLLRQIG